MAMDTSIKENTKDKWSSNEQTSFKNGNHKKNGKGYTVAHVNVNGNSCVKKEDMYKTDIQDSPEEKLSCGLGPCSPKWLQVSNTCIILFFR